MVPGAPARSLTLLGGGGVLGPVVARPGAEADTPEARVSEERAVSPMGSTVEVERATVGATPLSPRRVEEAAEAQAGVQRGAASGGAISEEAAAQEKGAEVAAKRVEEEEPTPRDVVSLGVKEARASTIAEAIEDLEKEASQAAEASIVAQAALDVEVREHKALRSAVRTAYEALDVEGVQSASSLGSRLIALSGRVHERLRGALHMGVKRALAVVSSHYAINLEAVSDGYVLPEDDEEADAENLLVEHPSMAMATHSRPAVSGGVESMISWKNTSLMSSSLMALLATSVSP
ncbi:uncharacterized protein [Miscanthus floridulus]|uniref:uncharacterized protein n=1 Tax=Miscanthus floridulus TaxID=154761 RepID=UPI003459111E